MKNQDSNKIFDVRMVQNGKPVGKAFRRKQASLVSTEKFSFKSSNKMGSLGSGTKLALKDQISKKVESATKSGTRKQLIPEDEKSLKQRKFHLHSQSTSPRPMPSSEKKSDSIHQKSCKRNFPVTGDSKCEKNNFKRQDLQSSNKRKFSEALPVPPAQNSKKLKTLKIENSNTESSASDLKVKHSDENKVPQKSKKKKNKKKKKKISESSDSSVKQYKPVLVVKGANDISANWKNLKEIITKCDKEQANKKEIKGTFKKVKHKRKVSGQPRNNNQDGITLAGNKEDSIKVYSSETKKQKSDIWFDNVDPILLGEEYEEEEGERSEADDDGIKEDKPIKRKGVKDSEEKPVNSSNTKAVAIDCEMVGVGLNGAESMLARVTIVNQQCKVIYDRFVRPQEPVVDYRTEFSGIRPEDIKNGHDFKTVQQEVSQIIKDKVLVGHGLDNDLRVLFLQHPRSKIRDTARYKPFRSMFRGSVPKLKMLARKILGVTIQAGEHDSGQDAQAAMRIYTVYRKEWESAKKKTYQLPKKKAKKAEASPDTPC